MKGSSIQTRNIRPLVVWRDPGRNLHGSEHGDCKGARGNEVVEGMVAKANYRCRLDQVEGLFRAHSTTHNRFLFGSEGMK